ncbi:MULTISPECIES: TetR/AcrR family transcriptional regulator [unclassified Brenneria]|uniref:TetR/AcrR family transcriptional regulator n=1 Tax=unclassified Brenneria TaxID=2634434 RepID=UPI001551C34C|nr:MULTISPECIES: TetR/AcrR family transcriptional regulator [unclassified Brenneria]MBJ7221324.1 TetR/AcrR family transcriptional regulator [Brenneria sp. L3-3C-1]MEE3642568.1 TetR/AcrR family transcriptional regulator [Brenneria sp. L3_3C_1]MEE3650060.1 TetR/AcrR family transcriptional regulator [Brenneria sp. HEZEL_4_2_4]NPD00019.1 TetR/AcrR family transcriptional regulator [Brenneria sp. hezel4-2-4]
MRRDQIIAAARLCFRRSGFHGAGMAEIAKHAQLSVGQIYRYFANKDAIIEEIVSRIVSNKLLFLTLGENRTSQMAKMLSERRLSGDESSREEDQALMLEVTAEATRNPRIAAILQESDARLFQQATVMLQQRYPHLTPPQIAARVEFMAALSEGTAFRMVIDQKASPAMLNQLYQHIFQHTFPEIINE